MPKYRSPYGTLDKRNGVFRLRLSVDGVRHSFSLPGRSLKEAQAFARTKYDELTEASMRRKAGLPGQVGVVELVDRYRKGPVRKLAESSQRSYGHSLDAWVRFLETRRLDHLAASEIRRGHIADFLGWAETQPGRWGRMPGPHVIARHRRVVSAMFGHALTWELVDANPAAGVKPPKTARRKAVILTAEQVQKLTDACTTPMARFFVVLVAETGLRTDSEAPWLRWEDIDLADGWLRVHAEHHKLKTESSARWVPLSRKAVDAAREHFARFRLVAYNGRRSPWVFHFEHDGPNGRKAGDRIGTLRQQLQAAAKRAGLPERWTPYDLRHRRATLLTADGKNLALVGASLGHKSLRTTKWYLHVKRDHLRTLVDDDDGKPERPEREENTG